MCNVRNKLLLLILRFLIRYAIYIVDKSKDIDYTWTSFDNGDNFKKYLYSIIDKIDEKNLSIDDRNNFSAVPYFFEIVIFALPIELALIVF